MKETASEENKDVEMVEYDGHQVPKSVIEKLIDQQQGVTSKLVRKEIKKLLGDDIPEDADLKNAKQSELFKLLESKVSSLENQLKEKSQAVEKKEKDSIDYEKELEKIKAEQEAVLNKERNELMVKNRQALARQEIKVEAMKLGLNEDIKDLFDSIIDSMISIDVDGDEVSFKDKVKDQFIMDENGPVGPAKIAQMIREKKPSAFSQQKNGFGIVPGINLGGTKVDVMKTSVEDLLSFGDFDKAK